MNELYHDLQWRGLVNQCTDPEGMPQWLSEKPRTVYCGFDPTASSLHVGSLVPLLYLRRFQQAGHRPIALVGGATGMIGDPSGKSAERNLLSVDVLRENVAGMQRQMRRFLEFDGPHAAVLVNNFDWMSEFSFLDFLRDIGKNAPVNVMLTKDSVKSRLESGISFTEFSYMLLQAYDFVHLHRTHNCELQLGGSDQWGNVTAGIDLARRMDGVQLYGITCPLLTKKDGSKMGKTEAGTVWLDPQRTSPYAFYQYWINVDDEDVGGCLRMLTDLDHQEIQSLDESREAEPHKRESQRRLAQWLTSLVHGGDGLAAAERATQVFFGAAFEDLTADQLAEIFSEVPSVEIKRADLEKMSLIDALCRSGLTKSNSQARQAIEGGGVYINNVKVLQDGQNKRDVVKRTLAADDLVGNRLLVLRKGKKNYALLKFI